MRKVFYLFGILSDEDCQWLAKIGSTVSLRKGEVLIQQGSKVAGMFILIEGKLAVELTNLGIIAILEAGEVVGEMSIIDNRNASATVSALENTVLLKISRDALMTKINADVGFSARIHRAISLFLAFRMRGVMQRMGYGDEVKTVNLEENIESEDEIELELLERIHLAGARFDRICHSLLLQK